MKKVLMALLLVSCFFVSGCGNKTLKEGTYKGTAIDNYGGEENTASAEIKIDAEGKITSVYLDTTYKGSTKKALKDEYGMKGHPYGSQIGEWYEQVENLENAIVEHQGTTFLALDKDGKTDAVSGCTISVSALVEAANKALEQAK